jgi:hypothetical protein
LAKKSAKAAQLDTFAALQSVCDPAENCVDDVLDVALMEVGTAGRHVLHKFRTDRAASNSKCCESGSASWNRTRYAIHRARPA